MIAKNCCWDFQTKRDHIPSLNLSGSILVHQERNVAHV